MSSGTVGAASVTGLARASASCQSTVPGGTLATVPGGALACAPLPCPPTTNTARSQGQWARTASTRGAASASTTTTRARLSSRRNAYSSAAISVLTGTATAPSLAAPQKAAANAGESLSTSSTRCSTSSPASASAPAARATRSATSPYVIVRPAKRKAVRVARPSATWRSTKKSAALKCSGRGSTAEILHQRRGRPLNATGQILQSRALAPAWPFGFPAVFDRSGPGSRRHRTCLLLLTPDMCQVGRVPGVATASLLAVAFTFWAAATAAGAPAPAVVPDQTQSTPRLSLSRLPLAFEPNSGQAPDDVRYISQA